MVESRGGGGSGGNRTALFKFNKFIGGNGIVQGIGGEGVGGVVGASWDLGHPAYVAIHTVTLALCLPYTVFFEAAASLLFGFFPGVLCVFSAELVGASLSFFLGRLVFRSSSSAMEWARINNYFHLLSTGVERDGWRFVLLARFSSVPSCVVYYSLAATNVGFLVDFLLPTVIGCLPMILQNTSIGSLAGAAVAFASGSNKVALWSYVLPLLGIVSSILTNAIVAHQFGFVTHNLYMITFIDLVDF